MSSPSIANVVFSGVTISGLVFLAILHTLTQIRMKKLERANLTLQSRLETSKALNDNKARRIALQEEEMYDRTLMIRNKARELCSMAAQRSAIESELYKANKYCADLHRYIDTKDGLVQGLEEDIHRLTQDNHFLLASEADMAALLHDKNEQMSSLQKHIQQLESQAHFSAYLCKDKDFLIQERENTLRALQGQMHEMEREGRGLRSEVRTGRDTMARQDAALREKDSRIRALAEENVRLELRLEEREEKVRCWERNMARMGRALGARLGHAGVRVGVQVGGWEREYGDGDETEEERVDSVMDEDEDVSEEEAEEEDEYVSGEEEEEDDDLGVMSLDEDENEYDEDDDLDFVEVDGRED